MDWQDLKEALLDHAQKKSDALRLDKMRRRVRYQCFLAAEGTVQAREAKAGTDARYVQMENEWIQAETESNLAYANVEHLRLRFDAWRTESAMEREKLSKGIYGSGT